jgi:hypothetical protein
MDFIALYIVKAVFCPSLKEFSNAVHFCGLRFHVQIAFAVKAWRKRRKPESRRRGALKLVFCVCPFDLSRHIA